MWRENAWPRTTLPVPVFLNRLDAPFADFNSLAQVLGKHFVQASYPFSLGIGAPNDDAGLSF